MGVVGQYGRGRFVDDANDLQPGELACLASRLALAVVEKGGHGDHGLGDRFSQRLLGPVLERPENDCRNFLWAVLFLSQSDRYFLAHFPLDRADGSFRCQDELVTCGPADQQAALGIEAHDRRQDRISIVFQYDGFAVANDGDLAIGGSQVDADDGVHESLPT
jgi:hypothetical protein